MSFLSFHMVKQNTEYKLHYGVIVYFAIRIRIECLNHPIQNDLDIKYLTCAPAETTGHPRGQ